MNIKIHHLKRATAIAFSVLLLIWQSAFAQETEDSADTGVMGSGGSGGSGGGGQLNFQADLFTGRFSYTVPIKVAPGRQGAEPKLALGYNSSGRNSWCGVGWSLETGYIQRDTRKGVPILMGATNPIPQYDDSKGFVVSIGGSMGNLICISPTNQNPVVYRMHVDTSLLTFNYYTNNHWEVVDKGGNTFYFGEGITNQMENPKTNWIQGAGSSTFRWALDRVVDVNGNESFMNYATDSNCLYLTNIAYNANINSPALAATHQVSFILTNRPDTNISFLSGYRVQTQKLLGEIDVAVSGAGVRKYVLNYTPSPSTLRSLLTSVTEYGSDFSTALPPVTFNYQVKPFTFGADTNWPGLYDNGETWSSNRAVDDDGDTKEQPCDLDGDGFPDRLRRDYSGSGPYTKFYAEMNQNGSFKMDPATSYDYTIGTLDSQGQTSKNWNSPSSSSVTESTTIQDVIDINGDGYPDRVMRKLNTPYTNFYVQLNTGYISPTNTFLPGVIWTNVADYETTDYHWLHVRYKTYTDIIDMNGDGLPDRVSRKVNSPFNVFKVQLNTGGGFKQAVMWGPVDSQGQSGSSWSSLSSKDGDNNYQTILSDINGDGLPDRVMRLKATITNGWYVTDLPYTNFIVQLNNGAGFEPAEPWGPLDTQGTTTDTAWGSPIGTGGYQTWATLIDINGDGLADRVMRVRQSPFTNWVVQINTGSGFAPPVNWGPLDSQGSGDDSWNEISYVDSGDTWVDFYDINGDGLPDRVMRSRNSPFNKLVVQLNQGPFPDLLNSISNNIGGSVEVSYTASTTLNNRDKDWSSDPWTEGAKSLLPFNVWVVSQIKSSDGMGTISTNSYAFKGGYYNSIEREFRGFSQATVTDPLGTKTITYFHQSGGRDNTLSGEYLDSGSESKRGMPFRIDLIGSDGTTNKITLNKVEELLLNSNGWYFPFISQNIVMTYEGTNSYRATCKQFSYDTNTENLVLTANLGEVTNIVFLGQSFTDVGSDSIYTWFTYTNIGNILDKVSNVKNTSDSGGSSRLQEAQTTFDSHGRVISSKVWLDTAGAFVTVDSDVYDQYGNLTQSTDAAGITTATTYDSTYQQYPVTQITGTFTNTSTSDAKSGVTLIGIDAKGLVVSNTYDVFFRLVGSYISTNAYGPPSLWQSKISYSLGNIIGGVSTNCIHRQVNDAVDTANGFETYTFLDGVGRTIQTREEAETGQFRTVNACYDRRGNPYFQTLPYFSPGTNFTIASGNYLGALTEYDNVGRAYRVTPAVQGSFTSGNLTGTFSTGGDSGSPVGQATTAFKDGGNPWAIVVTDAEGKTKKCYRDAYGRTITIIDVTTSGNFSTSYAFDLVGNLTNVTDNAGNSTRMSYDSLGRKTSMIDPDMGTWSYSFDNANRMTQQIDARTNKLTFTYSDMIGRLTSKQIYNSGNSLVGTITYTYDISDDPNFTIYKGQLYKITDLQGYQRSSYDVRGRVLKTGRYLNLNSIEYVTQAAYDDADRVQQLVYPGNSATIKYSYDTAGNLSQVRSLAGTGTPEIFYTPQGGFNELGQLLSYTNGNGVLTTNTYYPNSKRLQRVWVHQGTTNLQDLTYTYDTVSNLKSLSDGVYSNSACASISGIVYDDLYRVKSLTSTARGSKNYGYNSIGNILTNQDNGSGIYSYGAKPHAVTSANGTTYAYDACGNMTTRGSQTLTYDEQNQLALVSATNSAVAFGYDDDGERLWRGGTNGYSIWIGGIYEINNGKVLCHVMADGKLIATFEPICGGLWSEVIGEKNWYVASTTIQSIFDWPFQHGRGAVTVFAGSWAGILGICLIGGRRVSLKRHEIRKALRLSCLWRSAVAFTLISAFLMAGTGNVEAGTFNPVFYYYHTDQVGSSNVLTDRSGLLVQHYEYATFGKTSFTDNTSAFPISNRFTGQIADDETGLYYYGGRYYDPQLGRFIQPDPTIPDPNDSQSLNRYSYCRNNPLTKVDPSGYEDFGGLDGSIDIDPISELFGGTGGVSLPASESITPSSDSYNNLFNVDSPTNLHNYPPPDSPLVSPPDSPSVSPPVSSDGVRSNFYIDTLGHAGGVGSPSIISSADTSATAPAAPAPKDQGGGWVGGMTNVGSLISNIPGPIGAIGGGIQAVGELWQGNYGSAAMAGITALANLGGAGWAVKAGVGCVAKLVTMSREANLLAKEVAANRAAFEAYKDSLRAAESAQIKAAASQAQMAEQGTIMAGTGGRVAFRGASRVAAEYGGNASDWVKKTSSTFTGPGGTKLETHWVENIVTGQRVEFKTKFP